MRSRRPPRTSYGYLAPDRARVRGWECNHPGCGRVSEPDDPPPARWPHPCPDCGADTDPTFPEPWAHEARGYRIRHDRASADHLRRSLAEVELHVWEYKDGWLRGDETAVGKAWRGFRAAQRRTGLPRGWLFHELVQLAAAADDLDRAAPELMEWYAELHLGPGLDDDNERRTAVRNFVSLSAIVLERTASIGHRDEERLMAAMRDVVRRGDEVLTESLHRQVRAAYERRARHLSKRQLERAVPPPAADRRRRTAVEDHIARVEARAGRRAAERTQRAWRQALQRPWTVDEKVRLATAWTGWAVGTDDPELAAEAYRHLVALVPQQVAARRDAQDRRRVLAAAQEHIEEAGYWLARDHRYQEAIVTLETGRAIGLSDGAAVSYADISATTGDGAVVYIAAAKAGGYALIAAARHDPQYVQLRRLNRAAVARLAADLLPGGEAGLRGAREVDAHAPAALDATAAALKRLWDDGVRDLVLHSARGAVVTWVPIGLLSLLPLHAAGEPGPPGDPATAWRHAGNFSAVRYAPNARTLRRCLDAAAAARGVPQTLLAVDVPSGPGAPVLHHVARETAEVAKRWPGPVRLAHGCTWEQFRAAAGEPGVWHLACHGEARPHAILDSRLLFADRDVTLGELQAELRPAPRRLAVLSACESNLTGTDLPNEVVGLPSALLRAGFAGVIASAWKVDDLATAYLMTAFYDRWCHAGHEPAVALHLAQQWLRTATRADLHNLLPCLEPGGGGEHPYGAPRFWSAFAYTGA
ncbi:CHAT domain-containing protein [Dactylosporangium sp. CA-139066]|uniref:CHAT domain-containing protein n=1 Tax=Dactylosporangium sp. CA-139066 TaxID=3239930 RepID=UPI003D93D75B